MPPRSKRQCYVAHRLQIAREAKKMHKASEENSSTCKTAVNEVEELVNATDVLDTDNEGKDPSFKLGSSTVNQEIHVAIKSCSNCCFVVHCFNSCELDTTCGYENL